MFTAGTHFNGHAKESNGHSAGVPEKRRGSRSLRDRTAQAKMNYQSRPGFSEVVHVRVCDVSSFGCGIISPVPLEPRAIVSIYGPFSNDATAKDIRLRASLRWAVAHPGGGFRCGLIFDEDFEAGPHTGPNSESHTSAPQPSDDVDHYEVLQINPKADMDTIHRVFRLMAQRYHPDNGESGDPEIFRKMYEAYKVLSDPVQRAAYDANLQSVQNKRWKIFDRPQAATGVAAERRKRQGALALLYVKRMQSPEHPGISLPELEELLGVPREHLEFSLWYLRENGLITRTDKGQAVITAKGVDEAERLEEADGPRLFLMPAAADPAR